MDTILHEWQIYHSISDEAFQELWHILFGHGLPGVPRQDNLNIEEHVEMDMVPTDELMFGKRPSIEPANDLSSLSGGLDPFALPSGSCLNAANTPPTRYPDHGFSTSNMFTYNDIGSCTGMASPHQLLYDDSLGCGVTIPAGSQMDPIIEPLLGDSFPTESLPLNFIGPQDASYTLDTSCDPSLLAPKQLVDRCTHKRKVVAQKRHRRSKNIAQTCALCWFLKRPVCFSHLVIYTALVIAYLLKCYTDEDAEVCKCCSAKMSPHLCVRVRFASAVVFTKCEFISKLLSARAKLFRGGQNLQSQAQMGTPALDAF